MHYLYCKNSEMVNITKYKNLGMIIVKKGKIWGWRGGTRGTLAKEAS